MAPTGLVLDYFERGRMKLNEKVLALLGSADSPTKVTKTGLLWLRWALSTPSNPRPSRQLSFVPSTGRRCAGAFAPAFAAGSLAHILAVARLVVAHGLQLPLSERLVPAFRGSSAGDDHNK